MKLLTGISPPVGADRSNAEGRPDRAAENSASLPAHDAYVAEEGVGLAGGGGAGPRVLEGITGRGGCLTVTPVAAQQDLRGRADGGGHLRHKRTAQEHPPAHREQVIWYFAL